MTEKKEVNDDAVLEVTAEIPAMPEPEEVAEFEVALETEVATAETKLDMPKFPCLLYDMGDADGIWQWHGPLRLWNNGKREFNEAEVEFTVPECMYDKHVEGFFKERNGKKVLHVVTAFLSGVTMTKFHAVSLARTMFGEHKPDNVEFVGMELVGDEHGFINVTKRMKNPKVAA